VASWDGKRRISRIDRVEILDVSKCFTDERRPTNIDTETGDAKIERATRTSLAREMQKRKRKENICCGT